MDIQITFPGGKKVDAQLGGFTIHTDQPPGSGGEGSAPTPFAYALASLGTCAGIFVLSYLQSRKLPTEGLSIAQHAEQDPRTGAITEVSLQIQLPKGIPEEHVAPIIRSAEACSVKKMMQNPPQFSITAQI